MTTRRPVMEYALLVRGTMTALDGFDETSNPVLDLDCLPLLTELSDLPRERLWRLGVPALGDAELVALVLGTGIRDRPVLEVAADLVRAIGGVAALSRSSPHELSQFSGIGRARAAGLSAAFELGRRAVEIAHHRRALACADDVYRIVAPRLAGVSQEMCFVLGVDVRNGLIDVVEVGRGGVAHVEVHPREVFRPLVRMAAAGGVLVHNHPTGDPTPSPLDCVLTRRMRDAGHVLGIPIIDHVVIAARAFRSMAEWMGTDF